MNLLSECYCKHGNNQNKCSGIQEESNAIYNQSYQRILLIYKYNSFHSRVLVKNGFKEQITLLTTQIRVNRKLSFKVT